MTDERCLGKRFFRALTDHQLADWRPVTPRGMFGWGGYPDCANVSAANREMRRRAKIAGMASPYEWLAKLSGDRVRWRVEFPKPLIGIQPKR